MASKKFLVDLDLNQNQLKNAVLENLASDPGSPVEGQTYYKTGDDSIYFDKAAGFTKVLDALDINTSTALSGAADTNIPSSLAIKTYVDNLILGLRWHESVRVASTANVALANGLENGDTVDGVTLATGDRVLLTAQTDPTENGVYVAVASGAASRAAAEDSGTELANSAYYVREGTTYGDTAFTITNDAITLGSTSIVAVQFSGAVPSATTSVQGKVELATQAETQAKTDTTRAVTPSGLADFTRKYAAAISASTGATVSAGTHGLGATSDLMVMLYEGSGPYVPVDASVSIAANGDVTWATNTSLTGRIVIIG